MLVGVGLLSIRACRSGTTAAACGDGKDNDADQRIDLADPGCVGNLLQTSEIDPPPQGNTTTSPTVITDTRPPATSSPTAASCQAVGNYEETGVEGRKSFSAELSPCETAIVVGYQVDNVAGGVSEMICGPASFTGAVSDGFLLSSYPRTGCAGGVREAASTGRGSRWAHATVKRC